MPRAAREQCCGGHLPHGSEGPAAGDAQRISQDVLGGEALDVVWNMTLLTNTISANVPYGKIGAIEALDGVASVTLENRYEPDVVSTGDADPDMATSGAMIGSTAAWADGYTGAGSRIAVIDTGTDTDHISFDGKAFEYSSSSWLPMRARARTSSSPLWICSVLTRSPLFCRS